MKWRIMGELYSPTINATKVSNFLAEYPKAVDQNVVVDTEDDDGNSYVAIDVVLAADINKAAAKTKMLNAITNNGITGRLNFHPCLHEQYEVDGVEKKCVGREVIL